MNAEKKRELHLKMTVWMLATIAVAGVLGFVLLKYAMPECYFKWYPSIPVYFFLLTISLAAGMMHYEKRRPDKMLVVFMLTRTIKFVCTVAALLLYYAFVRDSILAFGVTAFVFYMIHTAAELILFNNFSKAVKKGTE